MIPYRSSLSAIFALLVLMCWTVGTVQAQEGNLYWSDQGRTTFETAQLDGSMRQVLATGADPVLFALDSGAGMVYYIDSFSDQIFRTRFNGTDTETLVSNAGVSASGFVPDGFVIDTEGGAMYWSEPDSNRIRTANLDGSGLADFITADDGLGYPTGLALDAENDKLYFINSEADKIQRANLDGTNIEDIITDENAAISLVVDPTGGKLYWARPREDEIKRVNFDGTGEEVIIEGSSSRFGQPALTLAGDSLYFNEPGGFAGGGAIHRAHLDGSGLEEIVPGEDANDPTDLAVAGDTLYWAGGYLTRSTLDGANPERILTAFPQDVKVDVDAGRAFWLDQIQQLVRANLDGSQQVALLDGLGGSNLDELALDRQAQQIYFTAGPNIFRVDYDGQNLDTLATAQFTTAGIAVDVAAETVYWIGNSSGSFAWLRRANFDGTGEETLLENLNYARGLTIDVGGSKLYWGYGSTSDARHGVRQSNLDGTDSTTVFTTSGTPVDLAFGADGNIYWADSEEGAIRRSAPESGAIATLVTGLDTPYGLDVAGGEGTPVEHTSAGAALRLSSPAPNPFIAEAQFALSVPQSQRVSVALYDVLGRRVATLHSGLLAAGTSHRFTLDGDRLPAGVYFVRAVGEAFTATQTVVRAQ